MGTITENDFIQVKNDSFGNERYVIHFMHCLPEWAQDLPYDYRYREAVNLMRTIGGRAYRGKDFGGGIIFTSANLPDTIKKIEQTLQCIRDFTGTIQKTN